MDVTFFGGRNDICQQYLVEEFEKLFQSENGKGVWKGPSLSFTDG